MNILQYWFNKYINIFSYKFYICVNQLYYVEDEWINNTSFYLGICKFSLNDWRIINVKNKREFISQKIVIKKL